MAATVYLFQICFFLCLSADHTWIGLTDEGSEGLWEWYDTHTSPSFTDWSPTEPNALEGDEDCVCVDAWHDYRWFDHLCSLQKAPLCESTYDIH